VKISTSLNKSHNYKLYSEKNILKLFGVAMKQIKEMKPLIILGLSMAILNSCSRDSGQVLGSTSPKVKEKSFAIDIKTDQMAIESLKNESQELKRDYVISYYKFHSKEGKKDFLSLLKENHLTGLEAKTMAFRFVEDSIEDINNLTPYESSKIENLFNFLEKYNFEGKKLIEYLAFGRADELTLEEAKTGFNQFGHLKDKKKTDLVPFEIDVYKKYIADHYLAMISKMSPTSKIMISLPIITDDFKGKFPLVAEVVQDINQKLYTKLLSEQNLYSGVVEVAHEAPRIKNLEWHLRGSLRGGRCGSLGLNKNFTNIKDDHWAHNCQYSGGGSTNSINDVNAYIRSDFNAFANSFDITAVVASNIRGGYADNGNENQTSEIHYNFSGEGYIPSCSDMFKCSPFVSVKRLRRNKVERLYNNFSDINPRNSKERVIIGNSILNEGESILVDRSENDVKVAIELERNDAHVGACCHPTAGQQRIGISVSGLEMKGISQFFPILGNGLNHGRGTIFEDLQIPGATNSGELMSLIYSLKESGVNAASFLQIPQTYLRLLKSSLTAGRIPYDLMFGVSHLLDQLIENQIIPLEGKEQRFLSLLKANIFSKIKGGTKGYLLVRKSSLEDKEDRESFELTERLYQDIKNLLEKRENIGVISIIKRASALKVNPNVRAEVSDTEYIYSILNELSHIRKRMVDERNQNKNELEMIELALTQLGE